MAEDVVTLGGRLLRRHPRPGATICRIMLTVGGPQDGLWQWTYQAVIKGLSWKGLYHSGFEPTARLAAKVIDDMWFAATDGERFNPATRARSISQN